MPVIEQRVWVDSQGVVHGGEQVVGMIGPVGRIGAVAIAGANHLSVAQPASREQCTKDFGPMVTAGFAVHLGSAAELTHDQDQCILLQATLS